MSAMLVIFLVSLAALVVATVAACYARAADSFADKCHQRINGAMDKFHRLSYGQDDVRRLMHEVFGEGRSGRYPDMGLRDWARKWRGDLRRDVANLKSNSTFSLETKVLQSRVLTCESRLASLENRQAEEIIPTVSQDDISGLDKRIDTVSELRALDGADLRHIKADLAEGRRVHNNLARDYERLLEALGFERDKDGELVLQAPRKRK